MPDQTDALVRLHDGTEVIGGNSGEVVDKFLTLYQKSRPGMSADTRNMLKRLKDITKRLPDPSHDGVEEITLDEIESMVKKDANWMFRVSDMVYNTADVYKDLKAAIQETIPSEPKNVRSVRNMYDLLLDTLHNYEQDLLSETFDMSQRFLGQAGITQEITVGDFTPFFDDESQIHKTITNVLRQYINDVWLERYTAAKGEIQQDRETLLALHFRDFDEEEEAGVQSLKEDKKALFKAHDEMLENVASSQSQLEYLSKKIGVPAGTFLEDPVSWIPVGDLAPTSKAFVSEVKQLVSGERTSKYEVIKGWPGGKEYLASLGLTSKKKKKKRPKNKKKKSSKSGSQTGTQVETHSDGSSVYEDAVESLVSEVPVEETTETEAASKSKAASSKSVSLKPLKPKGHRPSRFEMMMKAVSGTLTSAPWSQDTATSQRSSKVAGDDWDTIRKEVQGELRTLRARLDQEAEKDREYTRRLLSESALTDEAKERLTAKEEIRGRRAGRRRPYTRPTNTTNYSRRAPTVVPVATGAARSTKASKATPSKDFDASSEAWPALGPSSTQERSVQEEREEKLGTVATEETANESEQEEEEEADFFTSKLASLNLDDYSTVGVDPYLVDLVTRHLPSVQQKYNNPDLTVTQLAACLGGWDHIASVA